MLRGLLESRDVTGNDTYWQRLQPDLDPNRGHDHDHRGASWKIFPARDNSGRSSVEAPSSSGACQRKDPAAHRSSSLHHPLPAADNMVGELHFRLVDVMENTQHSPPDSSNIHTARTSGFRMIFPHGSTDRERMEALLK